YGAKLELITVADLLQIKAVFRAPLAAGAESSGTQSIHQRASTTHEIRMNMRFKNVGDCHAMSSGNLQIDFHIGTWVNNSRNSGAVIADEVRNLCDAWRLHTLKNQSHDESPRKRLS